MTQYSEAEEIAKLIDSAEKIVVIQADNPDIDSLASALALESILAALGKDVWLYCGIDLPSYLRYLDGWDRVSKDLPKQFDLSLIVDTASDSLLMQLETDGSKNWLAAKPSIVLDHHSTEPTINFATILCIHKAVATGEIIYELAQQLRWELDIVSRKFIAMAILSDSLGLTSQSTTPRSIRIVADLVEAGVNLAELDSARRETLRREPELIHYKGDLLKRVEFHDDGRIATVSIPWEEIERYSPLYNPSMLVIDDMRLGINTRVAIAFKLYRDGKITAKIRCNFGYGIADKLAENFGGGGHPLASGYKITDGRDLAEVKAETISIASKLLDDKDQAKADEA
ncbi:MAG TPA: DHH family phosphoesterase [Gammaproteobacteria bacterium]|nr:DHH family phosphoesterase [Gammaproteobacteria bacterium]